MISSKSSEIKGISFNIDDYLLELKEKVDKLYDKEIITLNVKVDNKPIKIKFIDQAYYDISKASLGNNVRLESCDSAAEFYYFEADLTDYAPEFADCEKGIMPCGNANGYLWIVTNNLICADYARNRYYYIHKKDTPYLAAHVCVNLFLLWGMRNGMTMIHAASVGTDGKGVLISAKGGGGKSTLSVGCMLEGMDFVSDDYLMLKGQKSAYSVPIYGNVGLTPYIKEKYNPTLKTVWTNYTNGKEFLDITEIDVKPELLIKAIICPVIRDGKPEIVEANSAEVYAELVKSSIMQVGAVRNPLYIKMLSAKINGLPVYRMYVGPDLKENAEYLKEFIKKNL